MPFVNRIGSGSTRKFGFGAGMKPGAPTIGTATRGDQQATVAFTPPVMIGTGIPTYTATSSPGGFTASGSGSPLVVTGLSNGTSYTFTVTATNPFGSATSGASTPVTPAGVPATPNAPTASLPSTYGNTTASLSWTAPSNNGSAITDYLIQFSSNAGSSWTTFADGTSTATSTTVTGLSNGTAYVFRVAAVNNVNPGAYSSASNSVTPLNSKIPTPLFVMDDDTQGRVGINFSNYLDPIDQTYVASPSGGYFYNYFDCAGGFCPNDTSGTSHGWTGLLPETSRSASLKVQRFGYADSDTVFCSETSPPAPAPIDTTPISVTPIDVTPIDVTPIDVPAPIFTPAPCGATPSCSYFGCLCIKGDCICTD